MRISDWSSDVCSSDLAAGFVEIEPRRARPQRRRVAVTEVAEEVGAPGGAGEESGIDLVAVEAGHRPAGEPERACGNDEVGALQAAVAHRGLVDQLVLASEEDRKSVA